MLTSENFILMPCCELEKVNLTITNIQSITHAFDRTFVNLINQIFVGRMEMQMLEGSTPEGTSIGREGGRERGREGGRERGREGGRERGREGERRRREGESGGEG